MAVFFVFIIVIKFLNEFLQIWNCFSTYQFPKGKAELNLNNIYLYYYFLALTINAFAFKKVDSSLHLELQKLIIKRKRKYNRTFFHSLVFMMENICIKKQVLSFSTVIMSLWLFRSVRSRNFLVFECCAEALIILWRNGCKKLN